MAKNHKVKLNGRTQDVRSPQNVGAVIGILCKLPFRERRKLAWMILWGHKRAIKKAQKQEARGK